MNCCEELAFRVGPAVFDGAGDIHRARGHEGDQLVLVDRQGRLVARITFEIFAEPVRKEAVDPGHGLAVTSPRQRRAAASRVVRNCQGEARVGRCRPKGRFAVTRMPDDRHAGGVDILVGFEVVHRAAQAPGPGREGSPFVRVGAGLPLAVKQRMDPVPEAVVVVGVDVPAVNRREAVAVGNQHFDRPPRRRNGAREPFCADLAPALFPRLHARDRLRDERVVADRVVALEVQPEEHRDGIRALVGDVEQDGHEMLVAFREIDGDLLARGHVAQRVAVFAQDLEMQAFGASGSFPVDLGLEQRQQLGAAFRGPCPGVGPLFARDGRQRVREHVGRDLRFVVVYRRLLCPGAEQGQAAERQHRVFFHGGHDCSLRLMRVSASR